MKKISLMLFLFNMSIISLFCNSLFENLSNTTFIIEEHFSVLEKRDRNYLIQLYPDIEKSVLLMMVQLTLICIGTISIPSES